MTNSPAPAGNATPALPSWNAAFITLVVAFVTPESAFAALSISAFAPAVVVNLRALPIAPIILPTICTALTNSPAPAGNATPALPSWNAAFITLVVAFVTPGSAFAALSISAFAPAVVVNLNPSPIAVINLPIACASFANVPAPAGNTSPALPSLNAAMTTLFVVFPAACSIAALAALVVPEKIRPRPLAPNCFSAPIARPIAFPMRNMTGAPSNIAVPFTPATIPRNILAVPLNGAIIALPILPNIPVKPPAVRTAPAILPTRFPVLKPIAVTPANLCPRNPAFIPSIMPRPNVFMLISCTSGRNSLPRAFPSSVPTVAQLVPARE